MPRQFRARFAAHCLGVTFVFILVLVLALPPTASAQSCSNPGFDVREAVARWVSYCTNRSSDRTGYAIAAVAGKRAIPYLRAALPHACVAQQVEIEIALAKLGDDSALEALVQGDKAIPQDFNIIGDGRAIVALMEEYQEHSSEPLRFNAGDYVGTSPRAQILEAIYGLSIRLTDNPFSTKPSWTLQDIERVWLKYWDTHKGKQITTVPPVYESVPDPYLRCLARVVDWGFTQPILEIADRGGPEAEAILRKWVPPPEDYGGLSTSSGDLVLALAKLGDAQEFARIVSRPHSSWGFVQSMEYIGARKSVEVLMGDLKTPSEVSAANAAVFTACVQKYASAGRWRKAGIHSCQRAAPGLAQQDRAYQTSLLSALAHMVRDSPLAPDAGFTDENVQKWRAWWAKNKDTAQYIPNPLKASQLPLY